MTDHWAPFTITCTFGAVLITDRAHSARPQSRLATRRCRETYLKKYLQSEREIPAKDAGLTLVPFYACTARAAFTLCLRRTSTFPTLCFQKNPRRTNISREFLKVSPLKLLFLFHYYCLFFD